MGVEASRLQPPEGWPLLGWDEEVLRAFVDYVKHGSSGSFRITKWDFLEFTGSQALQDISSMFAAFEEGGETSVSSLLLVSALLLCNLRVPARFKVAECLRLFDWSGDGVLTHHDLVFLLQTCLRGLSCCVRGVPAVAEQEELERLCQEALGGGDTADAGAIGRWAWASLEVAGVLAALSPQDADAAAAVAAAASSEAAPARRAPRGLPNAAETQRSSVLASAAASGLEREVPASEEAAAGGEAADPVIAAEPPLVPVPTARELQAAAFARQLDGMLRSLRKHAALQDQRQTRHRNAVGQRLVLVALERSWARAFGAALPFVPACDVAPEALRLAVVNFPRVVCAGVVEGARFDVAWAAAALSGAADPRGAEQRAKACGIAADQLEAWLEQHGGDAAAADAIEAEVAALEARELELAKGLHATCVAMVEPRIDALRREIARAEGSRAYLDACGGGVAAAARLRAEVQELAASLQRELDALSPEAEALRERRAEYWAALTLRGALVRALQEAGDGAEALRLLRQRARCFRQAQGAGGLIADTDSMEDFPGGIAAALERHWRRCEGALAVLRSLLRPGGASQAGQGPLRLELCAADASRRLEVGTRRAVAAAYLSSVPDAAQGGANLAGGASRKRRINRTLRLLEALHAALREAPPGGPLLAALDAAAARLSTSLAPAPAGVPAPAEAPAPVEAEDGGGGEPAEGEAEGGEGGDGGVGAGGDSGSGGGPAPAADAPVEPDDADVVGMLRRRRFDSRAASAALVAARPLLKGAGALGARALAALERASTEAAESAAEAEARAASPGAFAERRRAERRAAAEEALLRCLRAGGFAAGTIAEVPADLSPESAAAHVGSELRRAYAQLLGPLADQEDSDAPDADAAGGFDARHVPGFDADAAFPWQRDDLGRLGLATSRVHEQAARHVGTLHALELARLLAEHGALGQPAPPDVDVLSFCAARRAEAGLLVALAEHRLAFAELELRRASEPLSSRSSQGGWRGASLGLPSNSRAGRFGSKLAGEDSLQQELERAQHQVALAAQGVLAACRARDLERSLRELAEEPALAALAAEGGVLHKLLGELSGSDAVAPQDRPFSLISPTPEPGSVPSTSGAPDEDVGPAPPVPHPSVWWRSPDPFFAAADPGAAPRCGRCLRLAGLVYDALRGSAACGGGGAPSAPPAAALEEYAVAFRLWALGQSRLLAAAVLARGAWGSDLLALAWRDSEVLARGAWRGELLRWHVGEHAALHWQCLQRASGFITPLSPRDAVFMSAGEIDAAAAEATSDLETAMRERGAAQLVALTRGPLPACLAASLERVASALEARLAGPPQLAETEGTSSTVGDADREHLLRGLGAAEAFARAAPQAAQPPPEAQGGERGPGLAVGLGTSCALRRLRALCEPGAELAAEPGVAARGVPVAAPARPKSVLSARAPSPPPPPPPAEE